MACVDLHVVVLHALGFQVFTSYTIMGFLAFGSHLREFHSLGSSWWACFTMMVGQFDFHRLNEAAPYLAPLFFASYMLLVYITLINMVRRPVCGGSWGGCDGGCCGGGRWGVHVDVNARTHR